MDKKSEKISKAVGELDADIIGKADSERQRLINKRNLAKRRAAIGFGSAAACLMLAAGVFAAAAGARGAIKHTDPEQPIDIAPPPTTVTTATTSEDISTTSPDGTLNDVITSESFHTGTIDSQTATSPVSEDSEPPETTTVTEPEPSMAPPTTTTVTEKTSEICSGVPTVPTTTATTKEAKPEKTTTTTTAEKPPHDDIETNAEYEAVLVNADYPYYNSLQELYDAADLVIVARNNRNESTILNIGDETPYTVSNMSVTSVFKGDENIDSIDVKQFGGCMNGTMYISNDVEQFVQNGEYLLFLETYDKSPASLLNPIQGMYYVEGATVTARPENSIAVTLEDLSVLSASTVSER